MEKTYVFVPGGWHGGWTFDPITKKLDQLHKRSLSLTLPGLESVPVERRQTINLDTHIQFVVDLILKEDIRNIILCGHSYAGLVITGVADAIPERIHALVYIDAYVPKDGDSCWSLTSQMYRDRFVAGAAHDGINVAVPAGIEDRRRPHPLATFMQSIKLTGRYAQILNQAFIYLTGWEGTPFSKQYEQLKNDAGWQVETIDSIHNVMREKPDQLMDILIHFEKHFQEPTL